MVEIDHDLLLLLGVIPPRQPHHLPIESPVIHTTLGSYFYP